MFADDTELKLTSLKQWKKALELYQLYARATGARLNLNKMKILAILPEGYRCPNKMYSSVEVIVNGSFEYLGILVGRDVDTSKFWADRLNDICSRIKS